MNDPSLVDELWFDDQRAESYLDGREVAGDPLADVLVGLRTLGLRPAPVPSASLAAVFGGSGVPTPDRARLTFGVILAGGLTFAVSGVAAAHDALPSPAQTVVTHVINAVTPFHISTPSLRAAPGPTDVPRPPPVTAPVAALGPRAHPPRPAPGPGAGRLTGDGSARAERRNGGRTERASASGSGRGGVADGEGHSIGRNDESRSDTGDDSMDGGRTEGAPATLSGDDGRSSGRDVGSGDRSGGGSSGSDSSDSSDSLAGDSGSGADDSDGSAGSDSGGKGSGSGSDDSDSGSPAD